ncbi:AraC family transcriptional regulator [Bradyrhizobium sp. S3.12.5]
MGRSRLSGRSTGLYGRSLGEKLGLEEAPAIVTRTLGQAEVAATHLQVINPTHELSGSLPSVDAYMISLAMDDAARNHYWEGGRQVSSAPIRAGQILISDIRRDPRVLVDRPYQSVVYYLPRMAIDLLTDEADQPHIDELQYEPGVWISDETIKHLTFSLTPAFRNPEEVSRLFMDHVTLAVARHTTQTYGAIAAPRPVKGGLAPWQERLAKELIANNLDGAISLGKIAVACGLSVEHFSRAFRNSTGFPPHTWLLRARVEAAKVMLRNQDALLPAIALRCGFADRSHFTRVFGRFVGLSPGAWRKLVTR